MVNAECSRKYRLTTRCPFKALTTQHQANLFWDSGPINPFNRHPGTRRVMTSRYPGSKKCTRISSCGKAMFTSAMIFAQTIISMLDVEKIHMISSLYQYGPATINGMRRIFYIEVPMCIFHILNDFIIKILIVVSTPWICAVNSTLSVKCVLFVLEQPHTIYQETNHLKIWEEFSTSSLGGKCQNLSICRNSTSIRHFFWECNLSSPWLKWPIQGPFSTGPCLIGNIHIQ